ESTVRYIREAVRTMRLHDYASVEPTEAAFAAWNTDLQTRMVPTVWNRGGCSSWYLDEHRRNTALWPRTTFVLRRLLRAFDARSYTVTAATPTTHQDQEPVTA